MKDKLRKLFRGTREDQMIACSLLVENYSVKKFLEEWLKDDPLLHRFLDSFTPDRRGVLFVEESAIVSDANSFYYHYSPRRWLLCDKFQVVICYGVYQPRLQVIEHK